MRLDRAVMRLVANDGSLVSLCLDDHRAMSLCDAKSLGKGII